MQPLYYFMKNIGAKSYLKYKRIHKNLLFDMSFGKNNMQRSL